MRDPVSKKEVESNWGRHWASPLTSTCTLRHLNTNEHRHTHLNEYVDTMCVNACMLIKDPVSPSRPLRGRTHQLIPYTPSILLDLSFPFFHFQMRSGAWRRKKASSLKVCQVSRSSSGCKGCFSSLWCGRLRVPSMLRAERNLICFSATWSWE